MVGDVGNTYWAWWVSVGTAGAGCVSLVNPRRRWVWRVSVGMQECVQVAPWHCHPGTVQCAHWHPGTCTVYNIWHCHPGTVPPCTVCTVQCATLYSVHCAMCYPGTHWFHCSQCSQCNALGAHLKTHSGEKPPRHPLICTAFQSTLFFTSTQIFTL